VTHLANCCKNCTTIYRYLRLLRLERKRLILVFCSMMQEICEWSAQLLLQATAILGTAGADGAASGAAGDSGSFSVAISAI
jgi:hypothetical protein